MNYKSFTASLILASVSIMPMALHAADAVPAAAPAASKASSLVVVDIQKILENSSATKGIRDEIKKLRDGYQGEIDKEEEELKKKEKELLDQRSVLSADAFEQKQKDFKGRVMEVQRNVQARRGKLDQAYGNAISEVQKQVEKIIADLAKTKGFTVAISKTQTLYVQDGLDISNEVLQRLNKDLPKVKVTVEKQGAAKPAK